MTPAVEWSNVTIRRGDTIVTREIDLAVERGSWISILGPNGAGKTSLVRTLTDLVPESGTVLVEGTSILDLDARARARLVAVVPQHPVIPPGLPVFDYVLLGRTPHQGLRYGASAEDRRRTHAVMQRLELDTFAVRPLDSLSGGERQRAVLARALTQDTPILILDEPTTFLDVGHQYDVLELVAELRADRQVTVITTMHDLSLAGQFADVVAILHGGRVMASGSPADTLTAERIATAWGVDAITEVDDHGAVSITIRRRRERPFPSFAHAYEEQT